MKNKTIIIVVLALALLGFALQYLMQESAKEKLPNEELVNEGGPEAEKKENIFCFGERTLSDFGTEASPEYNYSMIVFDVSDPEKVQGYARYYPYGTDSGVSSLAGVYYPETHVLRTLSSSYAEGMNFEDHRIWKLENDQLISGYTQAQLGGLEEDFKNLDSVIWNSDHPTKKIDCATIDQWLEEVYAQYEYPEVDYQNIRKIVGDDEIDETTNITKRYLELDNNWRTQEILIFLESPHYCNLKGCTMFLVNEKDEILDMFRGVQKPVLIGNNIGKDTWADLAVWSEGSYRLLKHDGESYPSDLSHAPKLSERDVQWHPEKYFMVMSK